MSRLQPDHWANVADCERRIAARPKSPTAYIQLSEIYFQQGAAEECKDVLHRARQRCLRVHKPQLDVLGRYYRKHRYEAANDKNRLAGSDGTGSHMLAREEVPMFVARVSRGVSGGSRGVSGGTRGSRETKRPPRPTAQERPPQFVEESKYRQKGDTRNQHRDGRNQNEYRRAPKYGSGVMIAGEHHSPFQDPMQDPAGMTYVPNFPSITGSDLLDNVRFQWEKVPRRGSLPHFHPQDLPAHDHSPRHQEPPRQQESPRHRESPRYPDRARLNSRSPREMPAYEYADEERRGYTPDQRLTRAPPEYARNRRSYSRTPPEYSDEDRRRKPSRPKKTKKKKKKRKRKNRRSREELPLLEDHSQAPPLQVEMPEEPAEPDAAVEADGEPILSQETVDSMHGLVQQFHQAMDKATKVAEEVYTAQKELAVKVANTSPRHKSPRNASNRRNSNNRQSGELAPVLPPPRQAQPMPRLQQNGPVPVVFMSAKLDADTGKLVYTPIMADDRRIAAALDVPEMPSDGHGGPQRAGLFGSEDTNRIDGILGGNAQGSLVYMGPSRRRNNTHQRSPSTGISAGAEFLAGIRVNQGPSHRPSQQKVLVKIVPGGNVDVGRRAPRRRQDLRGRLQDSPRMRPAPNNLSWEQMAQYHREFQRSMQDIAEYEQKEAVERDLLLRDMSLPVSPNDSSARFGPSAQDQEGGRRFGAQTYGPSQNVVQERVPFDGPSSAINYRSPQFRQPVEQPPQHPQQPLFRRSPHPPPRQREFSVQTSAPSTPLMPNPPMRPAPEPRTESQPHDAGREPRSPKDEDDSALQDGYQRWLEQKRRKEATKEAESSAKEGKRKGKKSSKSSETRAQRDARRRRDRERANDARREAVQRIRKAREEKVYKKAEEQRRQEEERKRIKERRKLSRSRIAEELADHQRRYDSEKKRHRKRERHSSSERSSGRNRSENHEESASGLLTLDALGSDGLSDVVARRRPHERDVSTYSELEAEVSAEEREKAAKQRAAARERRLKRVLEEAGETAEAEYDREERRRERADRLDAINKRREQKKVDKIRKDREKEKEEDAAIKATIAARRRVARIKAEKRRKAAEAAQKRQKELEEAAEKKRQERLDRLARIRTLKEKEAARIAAKQEEDEQKRLKEQKRREAMRAKKAREERERRKEAALRGASNSPKSSGGQMVLRQNQEVAVMQQQAEVVTDMVVAEDAATVDDTRSGNILSTRGHFASPRSNEGEHGMVVAEPNTQVRSKHHPGLAGRMKGRTTGMITVEKGNAASPPPVAIRNRGSSRPSASRDGKPLGSHHGLVVDGEDPTRSGQSVIGASVSLRGRSRVGKGRTTAAEDAVVAPAKKRPTTNQKRFGRMSRLGGPIGVASRGSAMGGTKSSSGPMARSSELASNGPIGADSQGSRGMGMDAAISSGMVERHATQQAYNDITPTETADAQTVLQQNVSAPPPNAMAYQDLKQPRSEPNASVQRIGRAVAQANSASAAATVTREPAMPEPSPVLSPVGMVTAPLVMPQQLADPVPAVVDAGNVTAPAGTMFAPITSPVNEAVVPTGPAPQGGDPEISHAFQRALTGRPAEQAPTHAPSANDTNLMSEALPPREARAVNEKADEQHDQQHSPVPEELPAEDAKRDDQNASGEHEASRSPLSNDSASPTGQSPVPQDAVHIPDFILQGAQLPGVQEGSLKEGPGKGLVPLEALQEQVVDGETKRGDTWNALAALPSTPESGAGDGTLDDDSDFVKRVEAVARMRRIDPYFPEPLNPDPEAPAPSANLRKGLVVPAKSRLTKRVLWYLNSPMCRLTKGRRVEASVDDINMLLAQVKRMRSSSYATEAQLMQRISELRKFDIGEDAEEQHDVLTSMNVPDELQQDKQQVHFGLSVLRHLSDSPWCRQRVREQLKKINSSFSGTSSNFERVFGLIVDFTARPDWYLDGPPEEDDSPVLPTSPEHGKDVARLDTGRTSEPQVFLFSEEDQVASASATLPPPPFDSLYGNDDGESHENHNDQTRQSSESAEAFEPPEPNSVPQQPAESAERNEMPSAEQKDQPANPAPAPDQPVEAAKQVVTTGSVLQENPATQKVQATNAEPVDAVVNAGSQEVEPPTTQNSSQEVESAPSTVVAEPDVEVIDVAPVAAVPAVASASSESNEPETSKPEPQNADVERSNSGSESTEAQPNSVSQDVETTADDGIAQAQDNAAVIADSGANEGEASQPAASISDTAVPQPPSTMQVASPAVDTEAKNDDPTKDKEPSQGDSEDANSPTVVSSEDAAKSKSDYSGSDEVMRVNTLSPKLRRLVTSTSDVEHGDPPSQNGIWRKRSDTVSNIPHRPKSILPVATNEDEGIGELSVTPRSGQPIISPRSHSRSASISHRGVNLEDMYANAFLDYKTNNLYSLSRDQLGDLFDYYSQGKETLKGGIQLKRMARHFCVRVIEKVAADVRADFPDKEPEVVQDMVSKEIIYVLGKKELIQAEIPMARKMLKKLANREPGKQFTKAEFVMNWNNFAKSYLEKRDNASVNKGCAIM